jgi:hypothetical protein
MPKIFQHLTANLVGKPRFAVMEGRDYIVLPVTIMVEGVHAGSNGPTLYKLEDMEKFASAWNHKPVVVYHPKKGGQYVSADDPAILSANKVGILMANKIVGKAQDAEAWLEKSRLKDVDARILEAIDKGLIVEVSTGLFSDTDETPGTWNGSDYDRIASNYRPDHLALLPDLVGACSVQDGCGMFTAAEAMSMEKAESIQLMLNEAMDEEEESTNNKKKKKKKVHAYEMSHDQVRQELADTIWEETKYERVEKYQSSGYLHEVYDDYVVYCVEDKYYKQSYSKKDDAVELVGDPEEVNREVVYKPVANGDSDMSTTNCECKKEIKTLADGLIAANKDWKETDREWLQKQDETILNKLATMQVIPETKEEEEEVKEQPKEEPVKNTTTSTKKKAQTVEEFINSAPKPIREMLVRGLSAHQAERARLIDVITSNETNPFTEDELKAFEVPMLQKLAALAVEQETEEKTQPLDLFNFIGNAGAPQTQNHQEECLPLPVMNFQKK